MGKKVKQQVETQQEAKPVTKTIKKPTIQSKPVIGEVQAQPKLHALKLARLQAIRTKLPKQLHFDSKLVQQAVSILKGVSKQKKNNILDIGDDFVYLEIVLNKVPVKHSIRPVQIALPVPIYSEEMNSKFCIFCKNPQRKYKDFISEMNIPLFQRVVEYSKISKKFPTYNDRRKLFYEYDLFFCDKTIYPLLAKCTGKIFYERKKIPFPIDGDQVPADVQKGINSTKYEDYLNSLTKYTYFIQGNGPVYTLKVARVGFSEDDIVKNIMQGCYNVLPHLLLEQGMTLDCLRSINVKLSQTVALPIHTRLSEREVEVWRQQK